MSGDDKKNIISEFKLDPEAELRFEIETKNEKVLLTLKSGSAEVFGTELVKGKTYEFTSGAKIAVFTWQGCIVELKGKTDVSYVAKETPMVLYMNCHAGLDQMRLNAEKNNTKGPMCMVVGPNDVGKSTVCRILLNYAVRMGRRPLYVDVDLGQGQISVPGTIGSILVERPALIDEGFPQEAPLVYHDGHKSPGDNPALYKKLLTQLGSTIKDRLEINKKTKMSGCIINTCGWIKGVGYKFILHTMEAFNVNVILVLDQERLYNELVRDSPRFVKVVFLPKSGGVVERSKGARGEYRDQRIREYFYGTPKNALYPHSFEVKFSDVKIFKIGAPALPDSCLPLGMKARDHLTKLVLITPNPGLLHHLLSVSFSEKDDDDMILSHCAGFICVTNVDVERQQLTVLSPQPKPLPNNLLLLSELQFMDSH
ncbi:PREDICTED: protein CLP1 homolog [Nicrophorus vespilloides]|uniref:Protein CLP1 homolog n=1 Tax=Nicrophorus vespilloides TaxID=110193 RepID=A0ABM1MLG0_NICVS|nr:PREDICTED: protein CLP1 homolog [Nicrophorus vespilloides]